MSQTTLRFELADFADARPDPGYYRSIITSARFRHSTQGKPMLHVVHTVRGVAAEYRQVADYFVFDGVSPRGVATARRRVLQLCRACGQEPRPGDPVRPADLVQAELEVKLEHEEWDGRPRVKVVAYRRLPDEERSQAGE